jgi:hypothetical protein
MLLIQSLVNVDPTQQFISFVIPRSIDSARIVAAGFKLVTNATVATRKPGIQVFAENRTSLLFANNTFAAENANIDIVITDTLSSSVTRETVPGGANRLAAKFDLGRQLFVAGGYVVDLYSADSIAGDSIADGFLHLDQELFTFE